MHIQPLLAPDCWSTEGPSRWPNEGSPKWPLSWPTLFSTIGPHTATHGGPLLACTSNHYWPPTIGPCEAQAVGLMKAALSGPSINQSLKKKLQNCIPPHDANTFICTLCSEKTPTHILFHISMNYVCI